MSNLPDVPGVPKTLDRSIRTVLESLREHVRELRGFGGNADQRAVTNKEYTSGGGGTTIVVPGGPGGGTTPDYTPPPSPSGGEVYAGFAFIGIETDAPSFTQGNGYGRTNVYGAKWPISDATPPTFSGAVLVHEFIGPIGSFPTDLGTRWCIWLKWVSNDGIESTDPAGGTNGFQATTGKVGTSDLGNAIVLSQNLAPGSVTADKALLDIGGDNLLANNSFELDDGGGFSLGWAIADSSDGTVATRQPGRINGYCQRLAWTGINTTYKALTQSNVVGPTWGVRGGWLPGRTYVVSFYARADSAKATGCQMYWPVQAPASETVLKNPLLANTWQRYAFRIVWGGSVESNGRCRFGSIFGAAITGWLEFDDVQVEEGDTLSGYQGKLATNTIVAGDGAIANLAITNALIANLAVDSAKIANGAIVTAKIGDAQITAAKIADANITTAKIADAQITTAKIADAQITAAKIGDAQITTAKIGDAQITAAKVSSLNVGVISTAINGGSTGDRIEMVTNKIIVYGAGVNRVKIGDLS